MYVALYINYNVVPHRFPSTSCPGTQVLHPMLFGLWRSKPYFPYLQDRANMAARADGDDHQLPASTWASRRRRPRNVNEGHRLGIALVHVIACAVLRVLRI